ncbi:DUF2569 domain-containing protein [Kosakonia sp. BYX6]|uniref:DUF2569 domain-containing protein n=1 Tax=Kosakonia calanthes TaxID=3139408 RepID=A0ABZ3AZV6_9ENTR
MTTTPAERIGGWLLAPLAWLLVALLSTSLALLLYATALLTPQSVTALGTQPMKEMVLWFVSFAFAIAIWYYTFWLVIAFFKRRRLVPKHYIIWLLVCVLLAVKAFAFSPVSDELAVRQLLFPLLAAALLVPYFKRSSRVKKTFINP